MMMLTHSKNVFSSQHGVVIIVALVMLLAMTLIGITVMTGSTMQERMAGNNRQSSIARLEAEAALRQAEQYISGLNFIVPDDVSADFTGQDGLYITHPIRTLTDPPTADFSYYANWTNTNSVQADGMNTGTTSPRYTIEYLGEFKEEGDINLAVDVEDRFAIGTSPLVFRITAIGFGQNQNIFSILQSTYATQRGSAPAPAAP